MSNRRGVDRETAHGSTDGAVEEALRTGAGVQLQREMAALGVLDPSRYLALIASRGTEAIKLTLTIPPGEKLVRAAGVFARALDVWGHEGDAADFLVSPHAALDGDAPITRVRSESGAREVDELLTKLDLGLPA